MTIQFFGASGGVTGSMTLLSHNGFNLLIDAGQFQGTPKEETQNFEEFPFKMSDIHCILLTHAHIDHSGRIPLLVKRGYSGKILCTPPTSHLTEILLKDSGKIHETEAAWENKKRKRAGLPVIEPLFTEDDAVESFQYLYPIPYERAHTLTEHLSVTYVRAGHLLGSSSVIISYREDGIDKTLVFSGDLGNSTSLIEEPPTYVQKADTVILESTYGDRLHENIDHRTEQLIDIILDTTSKGGTVLIPSFAVGRTQEIIFELNHYIVTHPGDKSFVLKNIPIYLDSPLALEATKIYQSHIEYMGAPVKQFELPPFQMSNLHFVTSIEGSIALNINREPKVIISASGMCEAGRITHHLKHNLWKHSTSVVIIGFQAEGTLGRSLLEGIKQVKILDVDVIVNATIHDLHGFSGHADQQHLMAWFEHIQGVKKVFINHGETQAREALAKLISANPQIEIILPNINDIFTL